MCNLKCMRIKKVSLKKKSIYFVSEEYLQKMFLRLIHKVFKIRGLLSTEVAYLLLTLQPWVRFSAFPRIFL